MLGSEDRRAQRRELIAHLRSHACDLPREGSRHSWWHDPVLNKRSAVPRHVEIGNDLARKICRDLGVPPLR
ncbi:MAG: type II toxin-antitoxin system HicA family toxin [Actinomycetes bacterium]